jgi:hypothetical protein
VQPGTVSAPKYQQKHRKTGLFPDISEHYAQYPHYEVIKWGAAFLMFW